MTDKVAKPAPLTQARAKAATKPRKFALRSKDREFLIGNLAALLKAGVPIAEALTSLADTSSSPTFKKAMLQLTHDVDDGITLHAALERAGVASEGTLALIRFGEEAGTLTKNMEVAAAQEEKSRLFRSKVRSALIYPGFVLSLTLIVGLGIAWFLLPKLSDTFSHFGTDLPLISKIMIGVGTFLRQYGLVAVPAFIGVFLLILFLLFGARHTRFIGNALLLRLPGIRTLLIQVETARFCYLFGTLLQSGLAVTRSIELLERSTVSRRYQKFYAYLRTAYDDGYNLQMSFKKYPHSRKLFDASVQQMLVAGERSGSLSESLLSVAGTFEAKADVSTKNLETILEPILLVFVWLGVLGVAVSVILPIYQLVGNLGM